MINNINFFDLILYFYYFVYLMRIVVLFIL